MFAATALENNGLDANFRPIWNGGYTADDDLHGVMRWVGDITG
jgi:hypothetical protein